MNEAEGLIPCFSQSTGEELRLAWKQKEIPCPPSDPGSKMIQALLATICVVVFPYQGSSTILESGKVKDYEVVYPQKLLPLPKRGIERREEKTKYEDTMKYEFQVNGEPVVLNLEKNKRLFSNDYSETHYSPDGREITTNPPVQDHCYYHGHIQNDIDSTAVINACDGLNGYFKNNGEMYIIEPLKPSDNEAHAVFKYESLEKEDEIPKACGAIHSSGKSDEPIQKTAKIFSTPEEKEKYLEAEKYVELYMVADNLIYRKYSHNITNVRTRVSEILNYANAYYKDLNIHVVLIGLEIWSDEDKIEINGSSEPTLKAFAAWRHSDLLKRKRNDNAHLLTGIHFDGGVLGIAYISGMCNSLLSVGISQDNHNQERYIAAIVTHEMGHNLGMDHDAASCTCNKEPCIMEPSVNFNPPNEFSSCSFWYYQNYVMTETAQCILNDPLTTDIVPTAVCGNGFVEEEEECDCGPPEICKNECCEAAICKLKPEAECAVGECCEECQFKKAGELCRAAKDDCDMPELCTGQSAVCPYNHFHTDGHPCQNNLGYCFKGTCPTLASQCIALWGPGAEVASDECFMNNQKGSDYAYCRKENGTNIPCEPEDVKCGRLYCTDDSTEENSCKYRFSKENADFGMVETGTKCGEEMVCGFGHCMDLEKAFGPAISFSQM
ncbi:LOW QUALITY PROTEIN: zinc metalloproteinase-disintegrin-like NaMP [Ahaetulla prasina]|uniref:LOW QUALITY PROTEIN: zinc metalloproteinase-disintegrin-like NaMP n=1 Tax=Ahaetulla prasina TaxID=499056 RepID=UPI002648597E|nr:LOW QUALITY PROTEIN: zinc metalloproteinase-disintegrin-like NaMP [Ahaetulla prasina]